MSNELDDKLDMAQELYDLGLPLRQVAKELGVSHTLVWRRVTESGRTYAERVRRDTDTHDRVKTKQRIAMQTQRAIQKLMEG